MLGRTVEVGFRLLDNPIHLGLKFQYALPILIPPAIKVPGRVFSGHSSSKLEINNHEGMIPGHGAL